MKKLLLLVVLIGIGAYLYFVAPTPYRYEVKGDYQYRINRVTGERFRAAKDGWISLGNKIDVSPSDRLHDIGIENASKK